MSIFTISLNPIQASALGLTIIAITCLVALAIVKQRRNSELLRNRIEIYETQIGMLRDIQHESVRRLLDMQSGYSSDMENLRKNLLRKLASGDTKEIRRALASQVVSEAHNERFTSTFDHLFLNLNPTFIDDINSMLADDKQFTDITDGQLNNELRILALRRMGIEDTTAIASSLGLAVNTIYTYTNRSRSRAIDRDTFENYMSVRV